MENSQTPPMPAYKLPPPLPPLRSKETAPEQKERAISKEHPSKATKTSQHDTLTKKQKSRGRIVRYGVFGVSLLIAAGIMNLINRERSESAATTFSDTTSSAKQATVNSLPVNTQPAEQEVVVGNENEQAWQTVLSAQFKTYREEEDIPGQIERYKDDIGHRLITEAWGRSIYSDNQDTAIAEALSLLFGSKPDVMRTKDTLFVSTGIQELSNHENEYYYIVYCPKFTQSYSLYSKQGDSLFNSYSEKLLDAVRAMKASN